MNQDVEVDVRPDPDVDEIDNWLNSVEPDEADARDASHIRKIIAAAEALDAAAAELHAAVTDARSAGDTWDAIGVALGVSRQAAYQRFGRTTEIDPLTGIASVKDDPNKLQRPRARRATKASGAVRGAARSAITGRFVKSSTARRNPKTTVTEKSERKR